MKIAALALITATLAIGPVSAARKDSDATKLARELAGRTAGPAQTCVSTSRLGTATIYGDTLLYRDGATLWTNTIAQCPGLSRDPILINEVFGGQSCENDLMRTVDRGAGAIPGPTCRLGKFTPYRKPR